jgi:hypothetical protein
MAGTPGARQLFLPLGEARSAEASVLLVEDEPDVRAVAARIPVHLRYSTDDLRQQGALGSEEITIPKPFNLDSLVASVTAALLPDQPKRFSGGS